MRISAVQMVLFTQWMEAIIRKKQEERSRLWGTFAESWGASGDPLGRLGGGFGETLGRLGETLGDFGKALGRLWEALGRLWRALGTLWEGPTVRPSARPTDCLYKISPTRNSRSSSSAGPYL